MQDFTLDPRLAADSLPIVDLPLTTVRLMRDSNYPWLLLIPRMDGLAEILDLPPAGRAMLIGEVALASEALRRVTACEKLNVAALGNMVRQLHVHVIARRSDDAAWPNPVWGASPARAYAAGEAEALCAALANALRDQS